MEPLDPEAARTYLILKYGSIDEAINIWVQVYRAYTTIDTVMTGDVKIMHEYFTRYKN